MLLTSININQSRSQLIFHWLLNYLFYLFIYLCIKFSKKNFFNIIGKFALRIHCICIVCFTLCNRITNANFTLFLQCILHSMCNSHYILHPMCKIFCILRLWYFWAHKNRPSAVSQLRWPRQSRRISNPTTELMAKLDGGPTFTSSVGKSLCTCSFRWSICFASVQTESATAPICIHRKKLQHL